jgi:hypothetical protein
MRWFFLFFIALLAAIGNAAIFESWSLVRAIGGIAFNLFILSSLVICWSSYFSGDFTKARSLDIGHALLLLSAGIGFVSLGVNAALADSYESLMIGKSSSLKDQFMAFIQSLAYRHEFDLGIVLLGLLLAYKSIRYLIHRIFRNH